MASLLKKVLVKSMVSSVEISYEFPVVDEVRFRHLDDFPLALLKSTAMESSENSIEICSPFKLMMTGAQ